MELCNYTPPGSNSKVLVAVKRLRPSILKNKEELLAFVEETKLLRKLQHRCCTAQIACPDTGTLQHPLHLSASTSALQCKAGKIASSVHNA